MSRLIDADALKERMKRIAQDSFTLADWYGYWIKGMADAEDIIDAMPTVEPKRVMIEKGEFDTLYVDVDEDTRLATKRVCLKTGHLVEPFYKAKRGKWLKAGPYAVECSECGFCRVQKGTIDYCQSCGARMDL